MEVVVGLNLVRQVRHVNGVGYLMAELKAKILIVRAAPMWGLVLIGKRVTLGQHRARALRAVVCGVVMPTAILCLLLKRSLIAKRVQIRIGLAVLVLQVADAPQVRLHSTEALRLFMATANGIMQKTIRTATVML
jgi:hypothetical protein